MNKPAKFAIAVALIVVVGAVLAAKQSGRKQASAPCCPTVVALTDAADSAVTTPPAPVATQKLPKLVDLGAGKCIPCKMMAPILAELKRDYANRFITEFVDVWEYPDAGKPYGVQVIPTQIFFDADGKELFRHEGFFGKEDILARWKELGVGLDSKPVALSAVGETTNDQIIAYYFHGTVRCEACLKIEEQAREVIQQRFAPELATNRLVFSSVNYDVPENQSFREKYKLPCPSLVIVRRENGKEEQWKLLGKTWELVTSAVQFNEYVETEVDQYLRDKFEN